MKKSPDARVQQSAQQSRHRLPDAQALAFLAAIIAPDTALESPAEAAKAAARLWCAAAGIAGDYATLLSEGTDSLAHFLDSRDVSLTEWRAKTAARELLRVGCDGDSPLLDYINANLPDSLQFKSLRTLFVAFKPPVVDGAVEKDEAEMFTGLRRSLETTSRNERRRRSKKGGNKNRPGQS